MSNTSKRKQQSKSVTPLQPTNRLMGDDLYMYARLAFTLERAGQDLEGFGQAMKEKYGFGDHQILDAQGYIIDRPQLVDLTPPKHEKSEDTSPE